MSIHGIAFKERNEIPLSVIFSIKQILLIIFVCIGMLSAITILLNYTFAEFLVMWNIFFAIIFLCNIILEQNLKNDMISQNSKYLFALNQLKHEEQLKNEFATFLHDEVLQDLLSVKNMTSKSYRPEVQGIIYETLEQLNVHIRNQMQDYHPIILKSLTLKENLTNLIENVSETFPQKVLKVSFECSENLFLTEPYDVLIYRMIKELLTNVYKHSDGNHAWIILSVENDTIRLCICDNGNTNNHIKDATTTDAILHKGLLSIEEQINSLDGNINISANVPQGIRIEIILIMKGADSYKHFTN